MPKLLDRALSRFIPWLGYWAIRGLRRTMRIETRRSETVEAFLNEGKNYILAFWHGRQLMMPFVYTGKRISILISRHRDGELIARTVGYFGFHAARGSTTRGGATALRRLVQAARSGADLAVTPDGPRGPRYAAQLGTVELAKLTQLPIMPVAFGASKKKFLRPGTVF
ncbi:MAG: lysophospholipid acyltransferase family protein [Nitrospirae bacterium]|nr:lysophospholipid acyltransferase family protein [Nitrospirota bacterium]